MGSPRQESLRPYQLPQTTQPAADVFNPTSAPIRPISFFLPPIRPQGARPAKVPDSHISSAASSSPSWRVTNTCSDTIDNPEDSSPKLTSKSPCEPIASAAEFSKQLRKQPHSKATVKNLIQLRLRLSIEPIHWLEDFLLLYEGLEALEIVIERTYHLQPSEEEHGYRYACFHSDEINGPIQLEMMKCLRVIMNADLGFEKVLRLVGFMRWLAFSSSGPSPSFKAKIHAAEILGAICCLSPEHGIATVVKGFQSLVPHPDKTFFELVQSLAAKRIEELSAQDKRSESTEGVETDFNENLSLVWEYRCRVLALCNAIATKGFLWHDLLNKAKISDALLRLSGHDPPAAFIRQLEAWSANVNSSDSQESIHKSLMIQAMSPRPPDNWSVNSIKNLLRLFSQLQPSQKSEVENWINVDDSIVPASPPGALMSLLQQESKLPGERSNSSHRKPSETEAGTKAIKTDVDGGMQEIEESVEASLQINRVIAAKAKSEAKTALPLNLPPIQPLWIASVGSANVPLPPAPPAKILLTPPLEMPMPPLPPPPPPPPPPATTLTSQISKPIASQSLHSIPITGVTIDSVTVINNRAFSTARESEAKNHAPSSLKKLKPFFWTKIPVRSSKTAWDPSGIKETRIDLKTLEKEFAIDSPRNNLKTKDMSRLTTVGKAVTLLEINKANQIGILMARLKVSSSEIKGAIISLKDDFLSLETLKALRLFSPTLEEINTMNSFTGQISQLAISDQFFFSIKDIPRLKSRIGSMIYRRTFADDIQELEPELEVLRAATEELQSSKKLKTILLFVLEIGNTLNLHTYRGKAKAFELSGLLKLKEIKSSTKKEDSGNTLLHYLIRQIQNNSPSSLFLNNELSHLEAASRVAISDVMDSVKLLVNGRVHVKEEIESIRALESGDIKDMFIPEMEKFLEETEILMNSTKAKSQELREKIDDLVKYFAPENSRLKPDVLFGTLATFKLEYENAIAELSFEECEEESRETTDIIDFTKESEITNTASNSILNLSLSFKKRTKFFVNKAPSTPISQGMTKFFKNGSTHRKHISHLGAVVGSVGSASGKGGLDCAIRELRTGPKLKRTSHFLQREAEDSPTPASRIFLTG